MARKRKKKCPVPGCSWKGKILYGQNGHVTLRHPEYQPDEDIDAAMPTITPTQSPPPDDIPDSPVPETPKPPQEPVKDSRSWNFGWGKILLTAGGAVLIIISFFTGKEWMANYDQSTLGMFTALLFAAGAVLIYLAFKRKGSAYKRPTLRAGVKKYIGNANSIIIYAKPDPENPGKFKPWKIEFDNLKNPPGLKRKLRNDGVYYSLNICKGDHYNVDKDGNVTGLEDFTLSDTSYCDPRLLKDAVEMRYSREYYTPEPNLFQKIRPALFFLIVIIGALILVMVGNPAPPA